MTVEELIEKLKKHPLDSEISIAPACLVIERADPDEPGFSLFRTVRVPSFLLIRFALEKVAGGGE